MIISEVKLPMQQLQQFPSSIGNWLAPNLQYYIYEQYKSTNCGMDDKYMYQKASIGQLLCYGTALVNINGHEAAYYVVCEAYGYSMGDREFVTHVPVYMRNTAVKMYYPREFNVHIQLSCGSCQSCKCETRWNFKNAPAGQFYCTNSECALFILHSFSIRHLEFGKFQLTLDDITRDFKPPNTDKDKKCVRCATCRVCRRNTDGTKCKLHLKCPHKQKSAGINYKRLRSTLVPSI